MSVIVKGMEMPECCLRCYFFAGNGCNVTKTIFPDWMNIASKPQGCPIRPMPEKHGRLGDLDELKTSFADSINECKKWIKELEENGDNETLALANQAFCTFVEAALRLKSIPTIVEAEGEEEGSRE